MALELQGALNAIAGTSGLDAGGAANALLNQLPSGAGSPEGVVSASVGSLYRDRTNGTLYVKRTGTGSTGWRLVPAAPSTPSTYTQTFATAERTHPALTSAAVATTAATNAVPFGYSTAAQADALVAAVNALRTDLDAVKKIVNAIVDDLQATGLVQ